ncbi:30S ribosomal protein S5 [Candidatus Carsonella ruddii]|uniref:Small ribosomal subunit protein uS5 n=1 Tax=Candidatus Carsonella ruddii PC isolate NHV TaxID=1202540 RepID=J3YQX1_CARRU|nr:30S ribosomal protein S5 [Candidatus Carsonella ruddii]AFP84368.1 ribosomal protein S5 [Candidatus Carsonella ruddii PC isolate NHV]
MEKKLIKIHRVTKVVKGGRIFSYTATSIIGNHKKNIGLGRGKSREVIESIKKSYLKAKKNLLKLNLINNNIPYFLFAKHCATKVLLFPASNIVGLIASKHIKQVLSILGIPSVFSKIHGSTNSVNVIICTIKALSLVKK